MKENEENKLNKLITALLADYLVYAPVASGDDIKVEEVNNYKAIDLSGQITSNSWKNIFSPHHERLFDLAGDKIKAKYDVQPLVACLGMNILDLKALALYDVVFSNDIYYQNRRDKIVIIGYSADWPNEYKKLKVFSHNFEKDVLKHVSFDVFIAGIKSNSKNKTNKLKFYSGSQKGRDLLEKYDIKDFDHVEFTGAIAESGPDKRMTSIIDKIEKSYNHSLWNTLNDICLACGKCSIVCPTCFCFNLEDKSDPINSGRDRVQGNCFYNDFSKITGGSKELNTVKKKIYFWYTHKFVRIPTEYKLPGCVSCGRCSKVCPVGIDIFKNISKLAKIKTSKSVNKVKSVTLKKAK